LASVDRLNETNGGSLLGLPKRRLAAVFAWLSASAVAIAGLGFGIFQYYQPSPDKERERAEETVKSFQAFAASDGKKIAAYSENQDRKTYDLRKFTPKTEQYALLLNAFNLYESISYKYNTRFVDQDYIENELLCPMVKHYRTFILASSGPHGTIKAKIGSAGVFPVGKFENLDRLYEYWKGKSFNGKSLDARCENLWAP
jgi:hypothetical protein